MKQAIEAVNANPIFVTVDGVDVKKTLLTLVQSEPFELAFPTQNIFGPAPCNGLNTPPPPPPLNPLQPGIYSPAVALGYYIWLPPLSRGKHLISFSAFETTAPPVIGSNYQDVTYDITVVPVSLK